MITGLLAPPATVAAPSRTQLPYGLFSVLSPVTSADRWAAGGIQWEGLTCDPASGLPIECDLSDLMGDDGNFYTERADGSGLHMGQARPFSVHGYFKCGPVGFTPEEAQAKAEEHLLAREQARVEQALWNGDLNNYPNLKGEGYGEQDENFPFSAPDNLGTFSVEAAIAEAEEYMAAMIGSLGVIHVPRKLAVRLLSEGLVLQRSSGGQLATALGTPVVAGAGYTGNEIMVTPELFGFRSDVDSYTDTQGVFNPQTNDILAIASRDYVIGYDTCGTARIEVDPSSNGDSGSISFPDTMSVTVSEPVEVSNFPEPVTAVEVSNLPDNQDVTVTNTPLPTTSETESEAE